MIHDLLLDISPPWLDQPLRSICTTNYHACVPFVVITIQSFSHSWLFTRFEWRVHDGYLQWSKNCLSFRSIFLILVRFMLLNIVFCISLYFGHCIVIPSSIYDFWLHLWYLQTLFVTLLLDIISHNWFKKDRYTQTKTKLNESYTFTQTAFTSIVSYLI